MTTKEIWSERIIIDSDDLWVITINVSAYYNAEHKFLVIVRKGCSNKKEEQGQGFVFSHEEILKKNNLQIEKSYNYILFSINSIFLENILSEQEGIRKTILIVDEWKEYIFNILKKKEITND